MVLLWKKVNYWLENQGKRAKGQANFRSYHSIVDHLVTLKLIAEECCNNKSNLLCHFIDFRKDFDTMSMNNLWNRLQ